MDDLFKKVSDAMARDLGGISRQEIFDKLIQREKSSSTAISPLFALPHIVLEGKNKFQMIIVRSLKGIKFNDTMAKVHAMFFLAGSMDQRHFHLVVISNLARLVQDPDFEKLWLRTRNLKVLRKTLMTMVGNKKS